MTSRSHREGATQDPYRPPHAAPTDPDYRATAARRSFITGVILLTGSLLATIVLVAFCMWARATDPRHGGGYAIVGALGVMGVFVLPIGVIGLTLVLQNRSRGLAPGPDTQRGNAAPS